MNETTTLTGNVAELFNAMIIWLLKKNKKKTGLIHWTDWNKNFAQGTPNYILVGVIFSFQWRHSVESIRVGHRNCKPASSSQFRGDLTDFGWSVMRVVNRTNRNKNFVEEIASCTSVGPSDQWWRWISPSRASAFQLPWPDVNVEEPTQNHEIQSNRPISSVLFENSQQQQQQKKKNKKKNNPSVRHAVPVFASPIRPTSSTTVVQNGGRSSIQSTPSRTWPFPMPTIAVMAPKDWTLTRVTLS